jgi:hypothetical protein
VIDRKQAIAVTQKHVAHCRRAVLLDVADEAPAFETAPTSQQPARLEIREHDPVEWVHEDDGDRRAVKRAFEQQLFGSDRETLAEHGFADLVVESGEVTEFVIAMRGEAHAEVVVMETGDAEMEAVQGTAQWPQDPRHEPRAEGDAGQQRKQQPEQQVVGEPYDAAGNQTF